MNVILPDDEPSEAANRKIFCKNALVTFANKTLATVRTTDISYFDVYVVSPVHARQQTACLLDLIIPITPEENQRFKVKGVVVSSVYSKSSNGFKVGLAFLSPSANLLHRIHELK